MVGMRNGKRTKVEINVIFVDSKQGKIYHKTISVLLAGVYIKSAPVVLDHQSCVELMLCLQPEHSNVVHLISGFLVHTNNKGFAIAFLNYSSRFRQSLKQLLDAQNREIYPSVLQDSKNKQRKESIPQLHLVKG